MEHRLVILAGPTGVGKSDLAVSLAKRLDGEIISCDSMQIYRGMDIGSAKITEAEREGIPHHLLDFLDPATPFSAAEYQQLALEAIRGIQGRDRIPILTGGTGLYIDAVIYPLAFTAADRDDAIRARYEAVLNEQGVQALHAILTEQDPLAAARIHPNNVKRVIRALEVQAMTGRPFSSFEQAPTLRAEFQLFYYWLSMDRARLYERINQRVDLMMAQGLVAEVAALRDRGLDLRTQSMQGIGYKEILQALAGEITLAEAVDRIKQGTRNYAKRQMTWFRNDPNCTELSIEGMTDDQIVIKIESDVRSGITPQK